MPLVALKPGHSLELNGRDHDEVLNQSQREGRYLIEPRFDPIIIPHTIAPKAKQPYVVPDGGASIRNSGDVELAVMTPGL